MKKECLCLNCMERFEADYGLCPFCGYVIGTPVREPFQLTPGTLLQNKYTVGTALGYGGFSVTYLGYDNALDMKVAIKEYMPSEVSTRIPGNRNVTVTNRADLEQFRKGMDNFVEEARRMAGLEEIEGVARVYHVFSENGTAYIVMEYLDGETLDRKLKRCGRIEPEEAFTLLMPLMDSLETVHQKGILHRDISPDNIFFTKRNTIKLIDFGAARQAPQREKSKSLSVYVKPGYTPPEQYTEHGNQGTWTDVYSLAATIYKMLTGVTPPDGLARSAGEKIVPPEKYGVKISRSAETALMNAMNLDVEKRTRTVAEFRDQLYSTKEVRRVMDSKEKKVRTKIPLWAWITLSVAACGAIVFGVLLGTGVLIHRPAEIDHTMSEGMTQIPYLVSKSMTEAQEAAEKASLSLVVRDSIFSDDIPKDYIYGQDPLGLEYTEKNSDVYVYISAGAETVLIQEELVGLTKEKAVSILEGYGFSDSQIKTEEAESAFVKGLVCHTDIPADENSRMVIEKNKAITLQVSKGMTVDKTKKVKVPRFIGSLLDDAAETAKNTHLYIKVTYELSQEPRGTVLKQSVSEGKQSAEGTSVTLTVSMGDIEDAVLMPYLVGKSRESAAAELTELGLKCEIEYEEDNTIAHDHVIRQDHEKNEILTKGDTVTLVVNKGGKTAEPSDASKQESSRQESSRQESSRQESSRQESSRQESSRQESSKQESSQQESSKQESSRQESSRQESSKPPAVTLTGITILSEPAKTDYNLNESLDTSGLKVQASYSDGSTKIVTDSCQISGYDSSNIGVQTVTVSYQGMTASFKVEVTYKTQKTDYIYFDNSVTKWDTVYAYWWDSDGGHIVNLLGEDYSAGGFPGIQMTKSGAGNVYQCLIPFGAEYIVFSDGKTDAQIHAGAISYRTSDITFDAGSCAGMMFAVDSSEEPKAGRGINKTLYTYHTGTWTVYSPHFVPETI